MNRVYIERRVRPLNLYIREAARDNAVAAILDYGQAIKDLAETNIFPGDLLLKNFGVTASGRVVFYDYDEVALVTECRFRELPEPDDDFDLMDPGVTHYIGPHDIFPEEFIKFLAMEADLRKAFLAAHGDLLTRAVLAGREEPPAGGGDHARDSVPTAGAREGGRDDHLKAGLIRHPIVFRRRHVRNLRQNRLDNNFDKFNLETTHHKCNQTGWDRVHTLGCVVYISA